MHSSRLTATGCLVAFMGATALSAQAPMPTPQPPAIVEPDRLPMKPFSRLFDQQRSEAAAALRSRMRTDFGQQDFGRPNSSRRFFCTGLVLPGDPKIDPAIALPPPATATRFTMQVVQPSCH